MTDQRETRVETDVWTCDGRLNLVYTMRPDPPHNPLRYDFRWVDPEGDIVGGPFQANSDALAWKGGYDAAPAVVVFR